MAAERITATVTAGIVAATAAAGGPVRIGAIFSEIEPPVGFEKDYTEVIVEVSEIHGFTLQGEPLRGIEGGVWGNEPNERKRIQEAAQADAA